MDLFLCQYTLEDQHGTKKSPNWKGKSSSKPSFWRGSMLIFQGVTPPPPPKKKKYPILSHRCPPHLPMSSARIIALHRAAHLSETEVGWRNREILGTKKNGWVVFCLGPGVIFVCFFWKTNKHKGLPTHIWFTCVCCLVILELWLLSLLVEASNSFKIWGLDVEASKLSFRLDSWVENKN